MGEGGWGGGWVGAHNTQFLVGFLIDNIDRPVPCT
jgi:hypothetical protein